MKRNIYLSLDIDFWNTRQDKELEKVLNMVKDSGVPIKIVNNHKSLIPHVNKNNCDTLVNIDEHSDVTNRFITTSHGTREDRIGYYPCCGSWVNFVRKDLRNQYIWQYPYDLKFGYCHLRIRGHNPFIHPDTAGWKHTKEKPTIKFPYHWINKAKAVGIAMSYPYLSEDRINNLKYIVKEVFGHVPRNGHHGD